MVVAREEVVPFDYLKRYQMSCYRLESQGLLRSADRNPDGTGAATVLALLVLVTTGSVALGAQIFSRILRARLRLVTGCHLLAFLFAFTHVVLLWVPGASYPRRRELKTLIQRLLPSIYEIYEQLRDSISSQLYSVN